MSLVVFSAIGPRLRIGLAVVLIGWAIKLMDDYVDREMDQILGKPNITGLLGDGLPVYMALMTALAVYLSPDTGATLFLAAYLLGMGEEMGERYAVGWRAWIEVIASAVLGWLINRSLYLLNLLLILTIQLSDDLRDQEHDHLAGRRTLPALVGSEITLVVVLSLVVLILMRSPGYGAWVLINAWVIAWAAERVSVS